VARHREQGRAGLRCAPPGATLFLRGPERARNGRGRSAPDRCARDHSACGSVRRVRRRPPAARPGAAMNVSPRVMAATSRRCALRSRLAGIAVLQSDFERVAGRVWVCSRLSWIFGALFFCEELRSWSGLGSVGVGGPPRVDPCDASPRPVPRRAQAGLSGAQPPQPWLLFQAEAGRAHICRPDCALCALVSEIAIAQPSLALPKCPRTTKTTSLLGRPYPFKWRG
jgi:hypothetical protein